MSVVNYNRAYDQQSDTAIEPNMLLVLSAHRGGGNQKVEGDGCAYAATGAAEWLVLAVDPSTLNAYNQRWRIRRRMMRSPHSFWDSRNKMSRPTCDRGGVRRSDG